MIAWQNGRRDLAEVLLAAGANPDARNMYGDTAEEYSRYFAGEPSDDFATLKYMSHAFPRARDAARGPCD